MVPPPPPPPPAVAAKAGGRSLLHRFGPWLAVAAFLGVVGVGGWYVMTQAPSGPPHAAPLADVRGGGWSTAARTCRSPFRDANEPGFRYEALGFRVAWAPAPAR